MVTQPPSTPKSSLGCCLLKIFLALFFMFVIAVCVVLYNVYRVGSWVAGALEETPATFEKLSISDGEQQDITRILQELQPGQANAKLVDERITPNVFNGVLDGIIQGEKNKGKRNELEGLRGGLDGEHLSLSFSKETTTDKGDHGYINGKASLDLEIEDGVIKQAQVNSLNLGGREAPWTVLFAVNNFALKKLIDPDDTQTMQKTSGLHFIKLLKRDGDRLHIIVDPSQIKHNGGAPAPAGSKTEKEEL